MTSRTALIVVALLLLRAACPAEQRSINGVASVIDGDTIEIHGERKRLFGIDAPESRQECKQADGTRWRCGQQAAFALQDYIGRRPISCEQRDVDRYRRIVARCMVAGVDINAWLVGQGWAVAYTKYSRDYVREEAESRAAHRGVWSGDFVMPWEWRRGERPVWTAR